MKHMHAICRLFICLALLCLLNQFTYAQDEHSQHVTIAISNEQGIHFYTTSESAKLIPVGGLPPEIRLTDEISDNFWSLTSTNDLVISPDSQKIAFTAQRGDDYRLFIYNVVLDTLEQTPVQELFSLSWSPDSALLHLRVVGEYAFYDLEQKLLIPINSNSALGYPIWLPDSSGVIVVVGNGFFYIITTDNPDLVPFFDFRPLLTTEAGYLCNFHWSSGDQRYYFVTDCYGAEDEKPNEVLYSIDLNGNVRREIETSLWDIYTDEDAPRVNNIFSTSDGDKKYIFIETRDRLYTGVNNFHIAQVSAGQLINVYYRHFDPSAGNSSSALSPDNQKVVFTSQDWTDNTFGKGFIIVVDLETGTEIINEDIIQNRVCDARWIDTQRLVLVTSPDINCDPRHTDVTREVIELNVTTGTTVNLTEDTPGNVWILR